MACAGNLPSSFLSGVRFRGTIHILGFRKQRQAVATYQPAVDPHVFSDPRFRQKLLRYENPAPHGEIKNICVNISRGSENFVSPVMPF